MYPGFFLSGYFRLGPEMNRLPSKVRTDSHYTFVRGLPNEYTL